MTQRPSDLTLIAQAIAAHRSALLAYGDDLTLEQAREINDTVGFTFERYVAPDRTLRVSEYHLSDAELARAYRASDRYL